MRFLYFLSFTPLILSGFFITASIPRLEERISIPVPCAFFRKITTHENPIVSLKQINSSLGYELRGSYTKTGFSILFPQVMAPKTISIVITLKDNSSRFYQFTLHNASHEGPLS